MLRRSWPRADDLLAGLSAQYAGDMRGAEALPDPRDARQDLARQHDGLGRRLELVQAVVAAPQPSFAYRSPKYSDRCRWRQPTLVA